MRAFNLNRGLSLALLLSMMTVFLLLLLLPFYHNWYVAHHLFQLTDIKLEHGIRENLLLFVF